MATWQMSTISATYPRVCSIAQSKNTGQYMLAVVAATTGADLKGRIFNSNNYGSTWTLLQDLLADNGTDSSHLNYTKLEAGTNDTRSYDACVFYACAISDDGKYQAFGQKDAVALKRGIWYSTNYGNTTGSTDEKWKYIAYGASVRKNQTQSENFALGAIQMMYSPNPYPVFLSDYTQFRSYNHLTGLAPTTGSITALGNFVGSYHTCTVPALYDNDFATISRRVVYYISGGNLYKNIDGAAGVNINPPGWQVSSPGGGVAVSPDSNIVVAAKYANSTGGLWLSNNGGTNWTQKLVNVNLNAVDMSRDGKYIITSPMGGGNLTFYLSQDFGETWTSNVLSVTGDLLKLHITNDGKRVVGAGMKSRNPEWDQPSTAGYVTYIAPLTAAEQRAAGKTIAELIALSYSINDIRSAGYSANQLLAAGIVPDWNYDATANRLKQSYVNDFIDLSGTLLLRNNANLYVHGNTNVNGNLLMNDTIMQRDLSFNKRIFVGGDTSMNGNVTIANDVSLNGSVLGCTFNSNSIPTSAFVSTVTAPGPDYTKATIIYQKFQANGDVSMNGSTVQATNMTVNGNIVFNDGTKMNTYDDNKTVDYTKTTNTFTNNDVASTYNAGTAMGIMSSDDGKYVLNLYGASVESGGTNIYYNSSNSGSSGLFLSSDYGITYSLVTLPGVPVDPSGVNAPNLTANDLTKVTYLCAAVSPTGKYMMCSTSGTNQTQNTWYNSVIAFSSDYGATWSTQFTWRFLKQPSLVSSNSYNNALAVNTDATVIAVSMTDGTYISTNYMNSFSIRNSMPATSLRCRLDILSTNRILIPFAAGSFAGIRIYDLAGTLLYGYTNMMTHPYMAYSTSRSGNVIAVSNSWNNNSSMNPWCYLITTSDYITWTATFLTPSGTASTYTLPGLYNGTTATQTQIGSLISPSGKYVMFGKCGFGVQSITLNLIETPFYYNDNYGKNASGNYTIPTSGSAMFTSLTTAPYSSGSTTGYGNVNITDSGYIFVRYNGSSKKIVRLDFRIFKASTFTGLTIKNTLTAGSYVVSSDYRIKNNVAKLDKTFTVNNLRPVKYLQTLINKKQYGLIAHELQQYYPDLVFGEKDGQDLQRVNYTGLIAILINEIIQLKQEFRELEKKRKVAI